MTYYIAPGMLPSSIWGLLKQAFQMDKEELIGKCRLAKYVDARYTAMYILRKSGYSFAEAGKAFNKDRTTAIYAYGWVENRLKYDREYRKKTENINFETKYLIV